MSEGNKNIVRRLFEEVWNKGNLQVTDDLYPPNYSHRRLFDARCWAGPRE